MRFRSHAQGGCGRVTEPVFRNHRQLQKLYDPIPPCLLTMSKALALDGKRKSGQPVRTELGMFYSILTFNVPCYHFTCILNVKTTCHSTAFVNQRRFRCVSLPANSANCASSVEYFEVFSWSRWIGQDAC